MSFCRKRFAFARTFVGILTEQFFGVDERYFLRQSRSDVREAVIDVLFDFAYNGIDLFHRGFQIVERAVLGSYGFLPVPLVYVERMQVVEVFESADSVHVGV